MEQQLCIQKRESYRKTVSIHAGPLLGSLFVLY